MNMIIDDDPMFNRIRKADQPPPKVEKSESQIYEDMGDDSSYPLYTKDPEKKREYTIKVGITDGKLDKVFDNTTKTNEFNL
tara:strand:+ start:422 stop:664 length:243 start_codon:yes stop_codon:yes gene_type:complete